MNHNDELLTRSLAALADNNTEDDPEVEEHLAEFHNTYAKLANDPATVQQLDAYAAEADRALLIPNDDIPHQPDIDQNAGLRESLAEFQEELRKLRAQAGIERKRSMNWPSLTTSLIHIAVPLMIVGAVLLGIFAQSPSNGTVISTITIFAGAPAITLLVQTYLHFYLARRTTDHGSENAYRVLRLMQGEMSLQLRQAEANENVQLRQIEAREKVATGALRAAAPNGPLAVQLDDDHLQLEQRSSTEQRGPTIAVTSEHLTLNTTQDAD